MRAAGKERIHPLNSPASPTPAADAARVYVHFGAFGLICYDHDGTEQWRSEMPLPVNTFGTAASPTVANGRLIFVRDTNEASSLEAIDGATGKTIWRTDRAGFASGWSAPTLWRHGGIDQVLVLGVWWLTAYDLADGKELWSVPGLTDEPIVTPAVGEDLVYVTSYNMGKSPEVIGLPAFSTVLAECDADANGVLSLAEARTNRSILSRSDADGEGDHPLAIFFSFLDEDRDGSLTEQEYQKIFAWLAGFQHANAVVAVRPAGPGRAAEIVWQDGEGVPECPSPLYYRGRLYFVKNGGLVSCLDGRTGALVYRARLGSAGPCYASPVAGDGKIYSASARGVVTVFAAGDKLAVLAQNDLRTRIMATPALALGHVYVRTDSELLAFGPVE
ncbi:MAG: PQQ-binding-like beta-propeller repeat protein [Planctomycetota bacterium]